MPAVRVVDEHLLSPVLVYSSSNGVFQNELQLVVEDGLVKEQSGNQLIIRGFKFDNDLAVSLGGGRSFGRYASGTTIPSSGKTPAEVIQMAIVEPIDPSVSLSTSTSIRFNQTAINNVIDFSHVINTLGMSITSATLEWRRGETGTWSILSSDTSNTGTYIHILSDTSYNTAAFNYQYIVIDSAGATAIATLNIVPASYVIPTISLSVMPSTIIAPETANKREKGNISSNITGTITRNTENTTLISYTLQYRLNNTGSWFDIGLPINIGPGTSTITSIRHEDILLKSASSISYRALVADSYQLHLGTQIVSTTYTVNFVNLIFYGPAHVIPNTSNSVRSLPSRQFIDIGENITLNTGNLEKIFSIAFPVGTALNQILDLDALNANITNNYVISNISIIDAGGSAIQYSVYTMINAIPYNDNHRHQIIRS